ncbi:C25 family cysteine peptidase [Candidatus Uabimicrobium sp. HlEnr_7]|uniref:C25 family cysteine peptidase n=1 Tax=Candidatus Uabimicrobium helgolandensis TaxID=3095367 RepID=UPI0035591B14
MQKYIFLTFIIMSTICAEWQAIREAAPAGEQIKVRVLTATLNEMKIEISVGGYYQQEVTANQVSCAQVTIPGSSVLMEKGYPLVPKLGKLICIPDNCEVSLEVLSKIEVEKDLSAPILPSKGHLTRDVNPKDIAFQFASIYQHDAYWPSQQFSTGKKFIFRDVHGVRMRILPVQFNHVQKKMKILQRAIILLKFAVKKGYKLQQPKINTGKVYHKIYENSFLGYDKMVQSSIREGRKLLVVTPQQYQQTIAAWVNWKQKSGYEVMIHTTSDRDRSFEIKDDLKDLYDNPSTRFDYVVLIGDASDSGYYENCQPMPTFEGEYEGAAADRIYVRLKGYDNYPEACISRISGNTADEIKVQLEKIIHYEQTPPNGKWPQQGICVASDEGLFKDWQRAEWLQNGGSKSQNVPIEKGGLLANGFTSFADVYDPGAAPFQVAQAVNGGSSIICYIGHGTSTSWVSSGFNNNDIYQLLNNKTYPVIWSVACVNGKFANFNECFAEAWLRKKNGGAVAIEAASTNESWAPPCDKQAATINSIINNTATTFGAQELTGCLKAMEIWGDDNDSEGNKMAEQCNLFGDCTLMTRYGKQTRLQTEIAYEAGNTIFHLSSAKRNIQNATVTVYSNDFSYHVSYDTTVDGRVIIPNHSNQPLFYTVVAPNSIPIIDQRLK